MQRREVARAALELCGKMTIVPLPRLRLVSLMADNAAFFYRALGGYLTRRTGIPVEVEESVPWQERERMLDRGEVEMGIICGLPYVRKADRSASHLELLAAPVMQGARYGGKPVYFSDVVVRRDSPFRSFADLRGAAWAYNEPASHSGYCLTRCHLFRLGELRGYFSRVVEAGAHQTALRMVIDGAINASAIDSTVLELELKLHPELAPLIRVVDTFGPSPIPPAVISTRLPVGTRRGLRQALLDMHLDPDGEKILAAAMAARFVGVEDADYHAIRAMAVEATLVRWTSLPCLSSRAG
jgi:phosphonate transport system substrate-binding protein